MKRIPKDYCMCGHSKTDHRPICFATDTLEGLEYDCNCDWYERRFVSRRLEWIESQPERFNV